MCIEYVTTVNKYLHTLFVPVGDHLEGFVKFVINVSQSVILCVSRLVLQLVGCLVCHPFNQSGRQAYRKTNRKSY